jgi:hypothetical protein
MQLESLIRRPFLEYEVALKPLGVHHEFAVSPAFQQFGNLTQAFLRKISQNKTTTKHSHPAGARSWSSAKDRAAG